MLASPHMRNICMKYHRGMPLQHDSRGLLRRSPVRPALVFTCILGMGTSAWGQGLPSAGSILRQQEQSAPRRLEQLPQPGAVEPVRPPLRSTGGLQVTLRSVRFSGAQGLATEAELRALVQDSLGRQLDIGQLQELADRVTQFLKGKGWFLARAYLPEQDLTDGELDIAILAGRLEGGLPGIGVKAEGVRLGEERIRAIVAGALSDAGNQGLNVGHLERALLLLNDLPGISAQSVLERGKEPDTTRLTVVVHETPLFSGMATGDNFGSRYTGVARATALLRWNDPLRIGDQASLNAVAARGIAMAGLNYSLPLGSRGARLGFSASSLHYRIGEELASLGLSGTAQTAGANLGYPLVLSTRFNLRATLATDFKQLVDESNGTRLRNRHIANLTGSLSGDAVDAWAGGGFSTFGLALQQGRVNLSGVASDQAADRIGPNTQGHFTKATYNLARLQKLPGAFSGYLSVNGQFAGKNLDSSEKFVLGGNVGVRAYPAGEGAGDSGWLASAELRWDAPASTTYGNLQWFGFIDAGGITLNKNVWGAGAVTNAGNANSFHLAGGGLGVALNRTGAYSLRAYWAHAIGSNPGRSLAGNFSDGRAHRGRLQLTGTLFF